MIPFVDFHLTEVEARVLGSLVEKELTTPDYYPLSLNALLNACNQKSNRHPVMNLDEDVVRDALEDLNAMGLAGAAGGADSRVTKYEHRLQEAFNFTRPEMAIVCMLLLRGPQTPGELRGRTERLYGFGDLSEVQTTLQRLMKGDPPLVRMLARQPGTKEARYGHLLSGDLDIEESEPAPEAAAVASTADRLARLEEQIVVLQQETAELKQQLAEFRKQFE